VVREDDLCPYIPSQSTLKATIIALLVSQGRPADSSQPLDPDTADHMGKCTSLGPHYSQVKISWLNASAVECDGDFSSVTFTISS